MVPPSVFTTAAANLATHFTWVQRHSAGMRVKMDRDLVLTDSGLDCDTFNAACGARLADPAAGAGAGAGAADRIAGAVEWFAGRPFSWWLAPGDAPHHLGSLLEEAGLAPAEGELAMWIDLSSIQPAVIPADLEIRRVQCAEDLHAYARLLASLWSPPDPHVTAFYNQAQAVLISERAPLRLYLGLIDGVPVGTAEGTLSAGAVGIYNVSTDPRYRSRGVGSAMTRAPLIDARAGGLSIGILQAAPAGVSLYERIGFAPFGDVIEYKP